MDAPERPEDYISLIKKYLRLVPYMASRLSEENVTKTLSHPDLHLDNIFVDPHTKKISCIIDWQSSSVSEPFFQHRTPRMLLGSGSSDTGNASAGNTSSSLSSDSRALLALYHNSSMTRNPEIDNTRNGNGLRSFLVKPTSLLCGSWTRRDVFTFRHTLMGVYVSWGDIMPVDVACPISFTKEELTRHTDEMENVEGIGEALHTLNSTNQIPLGGMVPREYYKAVCQTNEEMKQNFIALAANDAQRLWFSRLWPYQDSKTIPSDIW